MMTLVLVGNLDGIGGEGRERTCMLSRRLWSVTG